MNKRKTNPNTENNGRKKQKKQDDKVYFMLKGESHTENQHGDNFITIDWIAFLRKTENNEKLYNIICDTYDKEDVLSDQHRWDNGKPELLCDYTVICTGSECTLQEAKAIKTLSYDMNVQNVYILDDSVSDKELKSIDQTESFSSLTLSLELITVNINNEEDSDSEEEE